MNRLIKLAIYIICLCFLVISKTDVYAEGSGFRAFVSSGLSDTDGDAIPSVYGNESYSYINFLNGKRYLEANRDMAGNWNAYKFDGTWASVGSKNGGADPDVIRTYSQTVYASTYGLDEFTGWTKVPGTNLGRKHGKQVYNGGGSFSGDLGKMWKGLDHGWQYLDKNTYWDNKWDFWRNGNWDEDQGVVDVIISADGQSATITRTLIIGGSGYVNYPLYNPETAADDAALGLGHEEWEGRFNGKTPYETNAGSTVSNNKVEHRFYGVGEKIYLFGTGGPTPPIENVPNNLKAISYVGDTKISSRNKYIKVGLKVNNSFATNLLDEDFKVEFPDGNNGGPYYFKKDVSTGTGEYLTYNIPMPNPAPAVPTNYKVKITINTDHNPEETNYNDNYKEAIITIYPPIIPPPNNVGNNINLYLSIEDIAKVDPTNWTRNPVTSLNTKAGYGIPLVAEIRGFDYQPWTSNGVQTYYTDFVVNSANVYVTTDLDTSFMFSPEELQKLVLDKSEINGDDEYERYGIRDFGQSKMHYRKLYTTVNQDDGTNYYMKVTAEANASWTEHVWEWWYNTGYPNYIDVYHWVEHPKDNITYTNTQEVNIGIEGTMYDDDDVIINR